MTSMRHKWGEKERPSPQRSLKHCLRCEMICVSRHEFEGGREVHWKEYCRGTERIHCDGTPPCEPQAAEVEA